MTIISFSGIDGAGKSTQIVELESWLRTSGLRTVLVTFWDDIVVFRRFRESMSHKVFKGDRGIGSPEKPLARRDKNVTSWPVSGLRFFLYLADAVNLTLKIARLQKTNADCLIFDRYIYDELANLPLANPVTRVFVRLILKTVPQPDVAYVVDAEPLAALARKPEYPVEFVRRNREAYLSVAKLAGNITVLEPDSIKVVEKRIKEQMLRKLATGRSSTFAMSL